MHGTMIVLLEHHGAAGLTTDDDGCTVADMTRALFRFPPELLELVTA